MTVAGHTNIILTFGVLLIFGHIAGKIANLLKLPKITGYITAGVLMEPAYLGLLPEKLIEHSTAISNFALCIITYAIGGSLNLRRIRELGKSMLWMTLFEAEVTFLLVFAGLFIALPLLGSYAGISVQPVFYMPLALLAAALASPTDPTATLAVRDEYKARGPVVTTMLGIGALDDALGIINFSIGMAICTAVLGGATGGALMTILKPLSDILFSILMGVGFALFLLIAGRKVKDKGVLIVLILGSLFACYGTAQFLNLDELLCTMALGCAVVNFAKDEDKFFISIRDYLEETVFVIFFVIAGANLQLNILKSLFWVVLIFVVLRTVGKFTGTFLGGVISKAQANVRKYTAFGLIPQGGIVVGLALVVTQDPTFSPISLPLLNLILGTTVLHEFVGPLFTEIALKKAKEVTRE
jgi:Kef-type K+ transport system membrane component KefB